MPGLMAQKNREKGAKRIKSHNCCKDDTLYDIPAIPYPSGGMDVLK